MREVREAAIFLCTGYSRKISEPHLINMGVRAIAFKPLVQRELAETVRTVLDAAGREGAS